jgi:hypothetical protein
MLRVKKQSLLHDAGQRSVLAYSSVGQAEGSEKGTRGGCPFSLLLVGALRQVVAEGSPEHVVGCLGRGPDT